MQRVLNTGFILLSFVAAVVTIVVGWSHWSGNTSKDGQIGLLTLSFFSLVFLVWIVCQEWRYARKARYSETLGTLNDIFYETQALALATNATSGQIIAECRRIVTQLANAFSMITGTKCSVCVKVIENVGNVAPRLKVATLVRDEMFKERNRADAASVDHWLDQNTDFEELFETEGVARRYYFTNYLPGRRGYKNTSFRIYGQPWDISVPLLGDILRDVTWKLPYKSTIVVPISPKETPANADSQLAGFLCVDSRSRGAFSRRYDLDLITGVADCLYVLIRKYSRLLEETTTPTGREGNHE